MTTSIDIGFPFTGRWLVQNSPADRVPSHGTPMLASAYAIDFVPVDDTGRTAPLTPGSLLRPEPPEAFPGFGRPLLAPAAGIVVAAYDEAPDHPAYRGLPSIGYALTQSRRSRAGWVALAGNHVLIDIGPAVIALCHLRRGSLAVRQGHRTRVGEVLALCGNTGNSTEPHVHVQAIDTPDIGRAVAVPLTFSGALPRNGEILDLSDESAPTHDVR